MNLFQLEMTAKQLYPDRFGEWPGYSSGDPYPENPGGRTAVRPHDGREHRHRDQLRTRTILRSHEKPAPSRRYGTVIALSDRVADELRVA